MDKQRVLLMILVLVALALVLFLMCKWKPEEQPLPQPKDEKVPPQEPIVEQTQPNNNYITDVADTTITKVKVDPSYQWVKECSQSIMDEFRIDHAHREIFKVLHGHIAECGPTRQMEKCDLLYAIFSQCKTLSVAKKMDLGVFLIWKSKKQPHIDSVYETILSYAADNQENPKVRANALEILMRSNNRIYMERSKRIMDSLKEHEKIQEMEQVRQRMERIQNVLQQRAPINPSTLRRVQPQAQDLRPAVPLTPEEVQVQHVLLDQYRRLERRAFNAMKHKASIYDDSQNVHNQKINESVIKSAQNIMGHATISSPHVMVEKELEKYYPQYEKQKDKIRDSLNRIRTDPSKFRGETTIAQVFDKIVSVVAGSRHKEEMWKRMGEELVDMNKLCATGHLSRIVNILQGFEGVPPEFQIQMDPKDEIYANISNYITMQIQNSGESDKLLESMIDPANRGFFLEFVSIVLQPKLAELQNDYEKIIGPERLQECVQSSLRNYIKNDQETDALVKTLYNK